MRQRTQTNETSKQTKLQIIYNTDNFIILRHPTRTTKYNRLVQKLTLPLYVLQMPTFDLKFIARASGYELERRFTKFVEITQSKSHYAVQDHSRSLILVPIESSYTISY